MKRTVQLPSGTILTLRLRDGVTPRAREKGGALFSELGALVRDRELVLQGAGGEIDPMTLELRDFHALRGIVTRLGGLAEEPVEFDCRNCGERLRHFPCKELPLGPFVDRELGDPELDATLDLSVPHAIPEVPLEDGEVARTVTLAPRTAAEALPLHRALRRRRLRVTPAVVAAMGVVALGRETRLDRLARALARCSDEAFGTITDSFLRAHYPPRLFSIALCPRCGARNDVDAPFEREFEPHATGQLRMEDGGETLSPLSGDTNGETFPSFEEFDRHVRGIAKDILEKEGIVLVVDGGVPACDDGGEPLLGSYVPGHEGDMAHPSRPPEITVYYRTFRAMWREDGPYDWRAEVRETLEHELTHHDLHLAGDDPMDEAEHRAIDEEVARVLGKKALARGSVVGLARDFTGFVKITWPIWLILIAAALLLTISSR